MLSFRGMIRILLLVLLAVITASSQPGGLDPRCEEHQCAVVEPYPQDFLADPTACGYGECPKCLVGPEWEARFAELGVGAAKRSFVPTIIFDDWLTAAISETIFRILAEETMQYTTDPAPLYPTGFDVLCCNKDIVALEKWPSVPMPDDEGYFSLTQIPIGYEGGSGLFVPKHTVDAYPLATSYNAYKYLPEYQSIFPKGYSTPCIDASVNKSLGCTAGNYFCDEETWTNTTCAAQGRYVPPQCEADPTSCQEIYFALPSFDVAFFEALIKNTGLKFIAVYLGAGGMPERVIADVKAGKHIMFYWYVPDSLVELVKGQPVVFPPPTLACRQGQRTDPTLSKGDCDYGKASLMKLARRSSLAKDGDFKFFFESFQISATQMGQMLGQHTSAGGTLPVYNVSCNWIRENYGTWKDWVRNTPPPSAGNATSGGDSAGRTTLIAAVASVGGVVVVGGVAIALYCFIEWNRLKHAPKDVQRAHAMFVALKKESVLWENCGESMPAVMQKFQKIVRSVAGGCGCYVVKNIGGAILVVSVKPAQIVNCAVELNKLLSGESWSLTREPKSRTAVVAHRVDADRGSCASHAPRDSHRSGPAHVETDSSALTTRDKIDDGSRSNWSASDGGSHATLMVRFGIGIHFDRVAISKDDDRRTYDYSGPAVDGAAVASDRAHGDQILVTNSFPRTECGLIESSFAEFCGVEWGRDTVLYQLNPPGMPVRHFDPKENSDDANVDSTAALLEQQSAGVTTKKVTVASIYLHDLELRASRMPRSAFAKYFSSKIAAIQQICKEEKGHLHTIVGPRVTLSFNAVSPTPQATLRAFTAVEKIREVEERDQEGHITAGIAADTTIVGNFKCGGESYDAIVSRAAEVAVALEQRCQHFTDAHCLATGTMLDELSCFAVVEAVDVVMLPNAAKPRLLVSVHQLKAHEEADREWLYDVSTGHFSALNTAFDHLITDAPDAVEECEAVLAAATPELRERCSFVNLKAIVDRIHDGMSAGQRSIPSAIAAHLSTRCGCGATK